MYEIEKQKLVEMCKNLYDRELVSASDGNVSYRVNAEHILITPSGKNKGFLKAEEIIVIDLEGNVVEGKGKASKEYPMHRKIYEKREKIRAVVHTHPVYATAFALAGKNIPEDYLIEYAVMLGKCGLAEYAAPGSQELVSAIEPFIADCNAILLKNHGAITYGVDLMDAYNKMENLESIAKTIIMSAILGEPERISAEEMNRLFGR